LSRAIFETEDSTVKVVHIFDKDNSEVALLLLDVATPYYR
jgi:hypothetical protein